MKKWIIPSNIKRYDVISAYNKLDVIDWTQRIKTIEVGDMVYVYVSAPVSAIKYCCEVIAKNLTSDTTELIDDSEFIVGDDFDVKESSEHMRLKKICEFADDEIPFSVMQEYGVKGNIQSARSLPKELEQYINGIKTEKGKSTIDCISLLDYLMENGGKPYKSPSKASEDELPVILEIKKKGQDAIKTLKAIGEACSEKFGPFKIDGGNWLDASYTKVREYLWAQLKYPELNDSPESISIFVEKGENTGEARFRVSLEIKDTGAKKEDYEKHYKSLELPLEVEQGFQYFLGGNNSDIEFGASEVSDPVEIKSMLDSGEIKKVQISCCIARDDISSNEELLKRIVDAVGVAKGYYDHVMGMGQPNSNYWPSLTEYDPGISKETYKHCLSDPNVVKYTSLDTVFHIYQSGGEATCKQLEKKFGGSANRYRINAQNVARWVAEETGCPKPEIGEGRSRIWPILFIGRNTGNDEEGHWVWKLRKPLEEAVKELDQEGFFEGLENGVVEKNMKDKFDKNMILYGPPGTGKTYYSVIYAVAICDGRTLQDVRSEEYGEVLARYKELKNAGRVAFTTFHQSYGYEEFIEGIKPVMDEEESDDIGYTIEDGIFKRFCAGAAEVEVSSPLFDIRQDASIWKVIIASGAKNDVKDECFQEGNMRIGFDLEEDAADASVREFVEDMQPGDVVLSFKTRETIDGIGIIGEGDADYLPGKSKYKAYRPVNWIATDIDENILNINNGKKLHRMTVSRVPHMAVEDILAVAVKYNTMLTTTKIEKNTKPYVFIIDEINRGNISKIFGELITLIEATKRKGATEAMAATLPYSQSSFSVPENVYILGTMNTADRSIALMDTALRRRFKFIEMMPKPDILKKLGADRIEADGEVLDVPAMLDCINARIEYLFDREHTIGHAFFTGLSEDPTVENLANIFLKNVIPLLQEYFYEDYSKIQLVLGDNGKSDDAYKFIKDTPIIMKELFRGNPELDLGDTKYEINKDAFYKIQSYLQI